MALPFEARISEIAHAMEDALQKTPQSACWLLCDSLLRGNSWLERLEDQGKSLPRLVTIWEFVEEIASPSLERLELKTVTPLQQEAIVARLWHDIEPTINDKTKQQIGATSGFIRTLQSTVQELRLAGIDSSGLEGESFPAREKGRFIQEFLARYESALHEQQLADPATVIALCRDRIIEDGVPSDIHLLVPQELKFTGLLQSVLDQIPVGSITPLRVPVAGQDGKAVKSDVERLAWLHQPQDAPDPFKDGTVILYRALSPEYEVRAVLGTLLKEGIPFDQAEVLYSDDIYRDLFYSLLAVAQPETSPVIPITMAAGTPVQWTRPGRAMRLWTLWIESGFQSQHIIELITQNLIQLPAVSSSECFTRLLRQAQGCIGRDAWERFLEKQLAKADLKEDQRAGWLQLNEFLEVHFSLIPDFPNGIDQAWNAAEQFLAKHIGIVDKLDAEARRAGLELIRSLRTAAFSTTADIWERLQYWASECHLPPENERPGCLMLTSLRRQESTHRPYTFCVGLSDESFPMIPMRKTLLSDRERKSISPELAQQVRRELIHQQEEALIVLLSLLHGKAVFTYSCADQNDDREQFPSQLFLRLFRLASQLPEADLHELESWLPPPLGPNSEICRITVTEEWLGHLNGNPYLDPLFKKDFPLLCRGAYAAGQRRKFLFTEFEGNVPAAGGQFDLKRANPVFSAHSLEQYARCSMRFFFEQILKLDQPSISETEPGRWLRPLVRGVILHSVFHRYHLELQNEKRLPHRQQDLALLQRILNKVLEEHQGNLPSVSPQIQQIELGELHETLNIFLGEESQWAERHLPRYFETSMGLRPGEEPSTLDTPKPIVVPLPSGRSISVQGRVDRIDEIKADTGGNETPQYFVWDYKTGRMTEYQDESSRRTGQLLQPLLYLEMVERHLRKVLKNNATVTGAGYFFPGQRGGQGDRLMWSAAELRKNSAVLDTILDLLQAGIFLPTEKEPTCEYCAYRSACQVGEVNRQASNKLKHNSGESLKRLWQLRKST